MKENLKLNPSLSMRALETQARKAAAYAAVRPKPVRKLANLQRIPEIELEIKAIFRVLASSVSESEVVLIDRPGNGVSCKAIISVYNREDLLRQKEEENACRQLGVHRKTYRAFPNVKYAIYPNVVDATKIGSIAIYGRDVEILRTVILRQGSLFGRRVISANLEMGRRLFIDVKLAA